MTLPYFKFYPNNWLGSQNVMLMSPEEEGAYIHLLAIAWNSQDCSLADDDAQLARLSRLGDKWGAAKARIKERFIAKDGKLYPKKLSDLHSDASEVSESKGAAAKERWGKEKYFESELEAFNELMNDQEWIETQEKYHPGLDVKLSLEKAHADFWGTEAGWEYSKRKKSKAKNWKLQFTNALSQKINQVWKARTGLHKSFGRQELSMDELRKQSEAIILS